MYLTTLSLEHFRCYERLDLELGPGLHVVVGPNGAGKTALLEAAYFLGVTKSHRTSLDRELIKWDRQWARVSGVLHTQQHQTVQLRIALWRGGQGHEQGGLPRKTVEVNSVPRRRLADVVGHAAVVLFGPEDLALVKGPPSVRRHFLNAGLAQVRPAYLMDLLRYRRALSQRNESLRAVAARGGDPSVIAAWDGQLAETAARISMAREEFCRALVPHVQEMHYRLSGGDEQIEMAYSSDLSPAPGLADKRVLMRELLTQNLERDLALGRTLRGPHRDDLVLRLQGRPLRTYGSQGQQRTAALALTLGQATVMAEWRQDPPILLLDDCLSELDKQRAARVLELTDRFEQMLLTSASWDLASLGLTQDARVLRVGQGTVSEEKQGDEQPARGDI